MASSSGAVILRIDDHPSSPMGESEPPSIVPMRGTPAPAASTYAMAEAFEWEGITNHVASLKGIL